MKVIVGCRKYWNSELITNIPVSERTDKGVNEQLNKSFRGKQQTNANIFLLQKYTVLKTGGVLQEGRGEEERRRGNMEIQQEERKGDNKMKQGEEITQSKETKQRRKKEGDQTSRGRETRGNKEIEKKEVKEIRREEETI